MMCMLYKRILILVERLCVIDFVRFACEATFYSRSSYYNVHLLFNRPIFLEITPG